MDKIDLSEKVAIITGASSGIGAETAIVFASFGAKLSVVGRDESRLIKTVNKCLSKSSLVPLLIKLDLTHPGSCETVIKKTVEKYGKIDILVNCAGKVMISSLFDNSMEVFDEVMNINFRVPYHLSQLALPYLVKTKGNIINIGSSMTKRSKPGLMPYTVSKAAVQVFSKHAALELASAGVRINSISPGYTKTNLTANLTNNDEMRDTINGELVQAMPNGKMLEPTEVALLICLTASDVFPNLNGSDLLLDGAASLA